MPLEESGKRLIQTHPHSGRVYVAGDTFTILDAWQAADAYQYALESGTQWINEAGVATNPGSWRNEGSGLTDTSMHHESIVGMSGGDSTIANGQTLQGFRYFTKATPYVANFGGELNGQHDSFALAIDFRFLSEKEFASGPQTGLSGIGARSQRIKVTLIEKSNPTATVLQTLVDIFVDKAYYAANVSPVVPANNAPELVNLADGIWPFEPSSPNTDGAINQLLWIGRIGNTLRKNGSGAAQLQVTYELPLSPSGASWSTITVLSNTYRNHAKPIKHPSTGIYMQNWGVLSLAFSTFREDGAFTQPVLPIGSHGRTQQQFPDTADFVLGQNLGASLFDELRTKGNAAKNVSWPSFYAGFRDFGGIVRPVHGDVARFQQTNVYRIDHTASQSRDIWVQVPHGATRFTLYTLVRFSTGCGLHTLSLTLNRDFTTLLGGNAVATQTLYTASFASGLAPTWVWVDQALGANMSPDQGKVERMKLTITATKATPSYLAASSQFYWDGFGAVYLAFR